MKQHIDLLGYLYLALGVLGLLGAFITLLVLTGAGLLSADAETFFITTAIGFIAALFFIVVSLPGFIAGYGLLKRRSWARPLTLVLGFLNLFNFPIGTILGIYSFWVLLKDEAAAQFSSTATRR